VALAYWGSGALVALIPPTVSLPALKDVSLNVTVLAYAAFVAIGAGVLFSVFAAMYSGRGAQGVASDRRHTMSKGARRTASLFVVVEAGGSTDAASDCGTAAPADCGFMLLTM
jgi:hypothetical protein